MCLPLPRLANWEKFILTGDSRSRDFVPTWLWTLEGTRRGFEENAWIGHTLSIGDEVRLKIIGPCGRCVMTTLAQGGLPKDPGILRAAVQHNQGHVGVYAAVARGGTIRHGDQVRLETYSVFGVKSSAWMGETRVR